MKGNDVYDGHNEYFGISYLNPKAQKLLKAKLNSLNIKNVGGEMAIVNYSKNNKQVSVTLHLDRWLYRASSHRKEEAVSKAYYSLLVSKISEKNGRGIEEIINELGALIK